MAERPSLKHLALKLLILLRELFFIALLLLTRLVGIISWKEPQKSSSASIEWSTNTDGEKICRRVRRLGETEIPRNTFPNNVFEFLEFGRKASNNGKCVGYRPGKDLPYVWLNYQEMIDRAKDFGAGLLALGAKSHSEYLVGIFAKTSVEWTVADYGCLAYGLVTAPIYDALGSEACFQLIDFFEIEMVICGGHSQIDALMHAGQWPPQLRTLITIEKLDESRLKALEELGVKVVDFETVLGLGRENPVPVSLAASDTVATLIFTSGTTGVPKGAMLTHENVVCAMKSVLESVKPATLNSQDVILGYLPLAHVFERLWEKLIHLHGGRVGYLYGEITNLSKDAMELKPTAFALVPRLLSRLREQITSHANKDPVRRLLFNLAMSHKMRAIASGHFEPDTIADHAILSAYSGILGGRNRLMCTGSAAVDGELLNFCRRIFSSYIFELYGQTESSGPITITEHGDVTTGHVGVPFFDVEVKLVDVPDMGYFAKNNQGEICSKSAFTMKGYLKMPEKTGETIDWDGWLHTGDIGEWTPEGKLRVIDRKKHIFKLSQGEYIAPERLEAIFSRSAYITNIFIDGDSLHPHPIALVFPNPAEFEGKLPETVIETIVADIKRIAVEGKVKSYEVPKRIHLLNEPFTMENGCLTQTDKAKRDFIRTLYRKELASLYTEY